MAQKVTRRKFPVDVEDALSVQGALFDVVLKSIGHLVNVKSWMEHSYAAGSSAMPRTLCTISKASSTSPSVYYDETIPPLNDPTVRTLSRFLNCFTRVLWSYFSKNPEGKEF
jgi:hypothetical protein